MLAEADELLGRPMPPPAVPDPAQFGQVDPNGARPDPWQWGHAAAAKAFCTTFEVDSPPAGTASESIGSGGFVATASTVPGWETG
jgi:hypothetical protein